VEGENFRVPDRESVNPCMDAGDRAMHGAIAEKVRRRVVC
jgi:hypothetical protein